MRTKRVAVTGAKGFIASHLIDTLKDAKIYDITCIDIKSGADVTSISNMEKVLEGMDAVFHLATLPLPLSLKNPYLVANEIYLMSLTLCELARQGIFKTLIQVSSSEAYGSANYTPMDEKHPLYPRTPYAAAKASADLVLKSYITTFGIDAAIIRPFNNYGPRQPIELGGIIPATINRILNNKRPIIYGDGEQCRDFIYVKDTARAILMAYETKHARGKIINIGSFKPVKISRLVYMISELMNYKERPIYTQDRVADVKMHYADIKVAKKILGFSPRHSLEQGLEKTIAWYKKSSN